MAQESVTQKESKRTLTEVAAVGGLAHMKKSITAVQLQGGWGCDPKLAYKSHMGLLAKR